MVVAKIKHTPVGSVTLAVAVDEACVPANGVLWTVVGVPDSGVTFTCTTVPVGMFAAASATVTGLVCTVGTVMSTGLLNEPAGLVGVAIPATDVMPSDGRFGGIAGFGVEVVKIALAGEILGLKLVKS